MRDLSAATCRRSGRGRPILFAPVGKKYAKSALLPRPIKPLGVIFAFAHTISLKNAKNSPALRQFRIFAARWAADSSLGRDSLLISHHLRATARHTPQVIVYASRWKYRARKNEVQQTFRFCLDQLFRGL